MIETYGSAVRLSFIQMWIRVWYLGINDFPYAQENSAIEMQYY